MKHLRQYIKGLIVEKTIRKEKNKRLLYHINRYRPARPQPKMKYMQDWDPNKLDADGEKGTFVKVPGTNNWDRWWMDSPIESGVFLTPNPLDIAMNHGRSGHVYAYRVPEWVIDKSGGMHRYDHGSELLIPEDVWNDAGKEIEFLGKSMDKEELWEKLNATSFHDRGHRTPTKPSWMSEEEETKWLANQNRFNLAGLRATSHPEDVVKMLKPEEIRAALTAFEEEEAARSQDKTIPAGPGERKGIKLTGIAGYDEKDEYLMDLLKKRLNESRLRRQIRNILLESIPLDIEVGDIILTGKFKNKRTVVKKIGKDEYGHPTINGKSILKFKIEKQLPQNKWSAKSREELVKEGTEILPILLPPPPSIDENLSELATITFHRFARTIDKERDKDLDENMEQLFDDILFSNGITSTIEEIKAIKNEPLPSITYHKEHFDHPRPHVLALEHDRDFDTDYNSLPSAHTPSYPSGHACQAYYVAFVLSSLYPHLQPQLLELSAAVAQSRINRGLHYPTDIIAGILLAQRLFNQ